MTGGIVGLETLRLKCQKHAVPFLFRRKAKNETTILPDAVIAPKFLIIALIHVDVVYALARREMEILVFLLFRSPLLTEREDGGIRVGNAEAHDVIDDLSKVVVVSRFIGRQRSHVTALKESAAQNLAPDLLVCF